MASFRGVPYAVPPTGKRRFLPAELSTEPYPAEGLNADAFGAPCIQNPAADPSEQPQPEAPPPSESCLFLNVFTPAGALSRAGNRTLDLQTGRPVMVWIHGGGFCIGAGSEAWFNASNLAAAEDVIVVTLNYRLGALGFMVLDGVPGTLGNGGMNGVNDQIVALRWVQAHAAAFGGDPSRVTIFGESSGGTSVCLLSVAPAARGLFERSIQQSGPCVGPWAPLSASLGRSITAQIKKSLNASTVEDLRRAPAEDVQWPDTYMSDLKIAPYFSAVFVDQGGVLPATTAELYSKQSAIVTREAIVGATTKDGTAAFYGTVPTMPGNKSRGDYNRGMAFIYGTRAGDVETAYPYERYGSSPQAAIVQSDADHSVICPTQRIARSLADALGPASVRAYAFSHHTRNGCDWGAELDVVDDDASPWPSEQLGWATHGSDVAYTFGALAGPEPLNYSRVLCPMNADERELNAKMMSFWADFARGGHAAIDTKQWPLFLSSTDEEGADGERTSRTARLRTAADGGIDAVANYRGSECAFWASYNGTNPLWGAASSTA